MKPSYFSKNILYRHLTIWLCFALYISFPTLVTGIHIPQLVYLGIFIANFIIAYYLLLYFAFYRLYEKRKIGFVITYFAVILLFISIRFFDDFVVIPFFYERGQATGLPSFDFFRNTLFHFSFIAFSTLGFYFNWRGTQRIKENAEKEKSVISRELSFLKNQFHSHLTFNFLNFCYGKMLKYAPKSAESVESFSEMLRYSLNEKQPESYVPLAKELEYIENFIVVQKCLSSTIFVNFKVAGDISRYQILPMMLSVFVENAFKHGIFCDLKNPIQIELSVKNEILLFSVQNFKSNKTTITTTGIGLENVKQLLRLFYSKNHSLHIEETVTSYKTDLTINFSN